MCVCVLLHSIHLQSFNKYYADELRLNAQFRQFILNASLLYGGGNTVAAQLHINQRWAANKGLHHAPRTHAHTRR